MRGRLLLCLSLSLALLTTAGCGLIGGDDDDDSADGSEGGLPEIGELDLDDIPEAPAPDQRPDPVIVAVSDVAAPSTGPAAGSNTITVQSGDVCGSIAANFGITTEDLEAANAGLDCAALQVGQQLVIPPIADEDPEEDGGDGATDDDSDAADDGGSAGTYTVEAGDSANAIASACAISVEELAALNPEVSDIAALDIGQVINVPEGCAP